MPTKSELIAALPAAIEAANAALAATESDGGTCNMDLLAICSREGLSRTAIVSACAKAGLTACFGTGHMWRNYVLVFPPTRGYQGFGRTAQVEAMRDSLRAAGFAVAVYYQMD